MPRTQIKDKPYTKTNIVLALVGALGKFHVNELKEEIRLRDEFDIQNKHLYAVTFDYLKRLKNQARVKGLGEGWFKLTPKGYRKIKYLRENNKLPEDLLEPDKKPHHPDVL